MHTWRVACSSDQTPSGKYVPPKRWATTVRTPQQLSKEPFGRGQSERAGGLRHDTSFSDHSSGQPVVFSSSRTRGDKGGNGVGGTRAAEYLGCRVKAARPFHFGPGQKVLWKAAVGSGLSSPIVWEGRIFLTEFDRRTSNSPPCASISARARFCWRRTVAAGVIEKVHELSSPATPTPATDGERVMSTSGLTVGVLWPGRNQQWEKRLPLPDNPYGASLHRLSPVNCWCSTIRERLLPARRQSPRRPDSLEDGSLIVSVRMVDSCALASRRDRRACRAGGDFKPNQRLMAYNLRMEPSDGG